MKKTEVEETTRFAEMFSAMGTDPRLRIMRLLLSAHPTGMVVGDIGSELDIPSSTLSHHREQLQIQELVRFRGVGSFLWYSANTQSLQDRLGFLFAECCTRNRVVEPENIICCK